MSYIIHRIRVSSDISVEASSRFRILLGLWILLVTTPTYRWLAEVPYNLYFHPWLEIFGWHIPKLDNSFYWVLDVISIISISLVTLGIRSRVFAIVFLLTNVVGYSIENSLGKINHGGLWFAMILCFALSDWSTKNALVPDRKWNIHKTVISIFSISICFGFLTAGIPKVLHWIDFDIQSSGVLKWWLSGLFTESHSGIFDFDMGRTPNLILEGLDYLAAIFEVSAFILLIMGKKYWRLWLIIASLFHLTNCMLFGITFISYIPVYSCFLLAYVLDKKENNINWILLISVVMIIGVIKVFLTFLEINFLFKDSIWNIYLSILFWLVLIVTSVINKDKCIKSI